MGRGRVHLSVERGGEQHGLCHTAHGQGPKTGDRGFTALHRGETAAEKNLWPFFTPEGLRVPGTDSVRPPPPGGMWSGGGRGGLRGPPGGAASCVRDREGSGGS